MPNTFQGRQLPTFPSTWYHPVFGSREVKTLEDYSKLGPDWRSDPGIADMDRTETEAQIVMHHNQEVKREMALKEAGSKEGKADAPEQTLTEFAFSKPSEDEESKKIVRNSVQAQQSLDEGNRSEPL